MKLVVSGSRSVKRDSWEHYMLRGILGNVWGVAYRRDVAYLEVVEGQSPGGGVDELVHEWAEETHIHVPIYSTRVPILAGEHPMARNTRMITTHRDADFFLAFNKGRSRGTADSLRKMRAVRLERQLAFDPIIPEIIEVNIA